MNFECLCNNSEGAKMKVLDSEGLIYLLTILKSSIDAEIEKSGGVKSVEVKNNVITLTYESGNTTKIVLPIASATKLGLVQIDADGGLEVDAAGTIGVKTGAGLVANDEGALEVDFSSMPTDKFEKMLKELNIPIKVQDNKYRAWYVDKNHENASDELVDGRGLSKSLPFKTIQACVDYVTENFNIGSYAVVINVNEGTYEENLVLGQQNKTSGSITIRPYTDAEVTVKATDGVLVDAKYGFYQLKNLAFDYSFVGAETAIELMLIKAEDSANVVILNCSFKAEDKTADGNNVAAYVLYANNGAIIKVNEADFDLTNFDKKVKTATVFAARGTGCIDFFSTTEEAPEIAINGAADILMSGWLTGYFRRSGKANTKLVGNIAAKAYKLTTASSISAGADMFAEAPNLTEGTLDTTTYCYAKGF